MTACLCFSPCSRSSIRFLACVLIYIGAFGCTSDKKETPTSGHLFVLIPETVAPPLIAEVEEFLRLYGSHGANIRYELVSSEQAVEQFVRDSVAMIFTTRRLTSVEKQTVEKRFNIPVEIAVASDGIVAVVNTNIRTEEISTQEIGALFSGRIRRWEQLVHNKGMNGPITIIMQDSSDISSFFFNRSSGRTQSPLRILRTSSERETLQKVAGNQDGLGFVGSSWIDSSRSPVRVLEIGQTSFSDTTLSRVAHEAIGKFFSPHLAYIYQNYYPLKRTIYVYNHTGGFDLAAGFTTFVATSEGQQLLLKCGIVPGTQPIRLRSSR